jgi:hypothetical protein
MNVASQAHSVLDEKRPILYHGTWLTVIINKSTGLSLGSASTA